MKIKRVSNEGVRSRNLLYAFCLYLMNDKGGNA